MKPIKLTFCLLLILFVSACQTQDEIPIQPETQRNIVSSSDIPEVTSSLLNQLGLRNGDKGFSVYSEGNAVGVAIDWDRVKQLIDTTGKQTYTFAIKDQDNDPNTFYNLIFQLSPENEPYKPYLMKYTMNDAFATTYYSGQANFGSFQGSVKKIRIQGFGNTSGSTYNDDGEEVLVGEDCPGDTQFNNDNGQGSTGSGGGSYGGIPIGEDDPDEEWMCEVFIQPTDWYSCTSTGCTYMYTDYEITYENCGLNTQLSSADDDGFCQPTDDNIPIIEPAIDPENLEEYLLNCQYTPQECLVEAIKSFREWGGEEGKAIATLLEDLISTPNLTLGEANEVYALAIQFTRNLNGQYSMAIFSVENVATILSFGITNNLTTAARQKLQEIVSRYASRFSLAKELTILGKYPEYLQLAEKIGANRFNIPANIWNSMTPLEQWAANARFLDDVIARGDDIILSNRVTDISQVTGAFRKELEYLIQRGYRLSHNGIRMIR